MSALDGSVTVKINNGDQGWGPPVNIASGVGTAGKNIRFARLQHTQRASYIAVDPATGGFAAWSVDSYPLPLFLYGPGEREGRNNMLT